MKSYLSIVFAALLLLPVSALAQTAEDDGSPAEEAPAQAGDEAPADEAPAEGEDGEAEEGEPEEGTAEDAEAEPAAGEDAEGAEGEAPELEPAMPPAPEPAGAGTAGTAVPGSGGTPAAEAAPAPGEGLAQPESPSLADDLAAAQNEADAEDAEDADVPPPEEREGVRYDVETGRFVEETEQVPWRNSLFLWDHAVGTYTFDPGISDNPSYVMAFSLRPRWYFADDVSLRLRQDLAVEFTDTDSRTRNREPVLSDTVIDFVHSKLYELEGIRFGAGGRLTLPTSITSRANTTLFGTGVLGTATKVFPDVLQSLVLQGSATYNHYWNRSNVGETETPFPCAGPPDDPVNNICEQSAGSSNVANVWTAGLAASLAPTQNLTLNTSFSWSWRLAQGLGSGTVGVETGDVELDDNSLTHWRNGTTFALGADYRFYDWLTVTGSFYTVTGNLDPDGSLRNPIYNQDSAVSLTATVTLDQVYTSITRRVAEEEESTATAQARAENGRAAQ